MADRKFAGVPVIPNASLVRGRLLEIKANPSGQGSEWTIAVEEARDVDELPNFAQDYVGKVIPVYVHPQLKATLVVQDSLEARIAYRGDERGGRFVLVGDELQKL